MENGKLGEFLSHLKNVLNFAKTEDICCEDFDKLILFVKTYMREDKKLLGYLCAIKNLLEENNVE